jgi:sugar phosphate isomerase/epimerase
VTGQPLRKAAISNFAWPKEMDAEALALAAELGFNGIEIAPGKVFSGWGAPALAQAHDYRARLADRGLAIPAMQGITFGVENIALFESPEARRRLADHLEQVARLAGAVGAHASVFGAPRLRDPGMLDFAQAFAIARDFFRAVAPAFADEGGTLSFEANPAAYGCRFITHTAEALALVEAVNHPGFRLQLDLGTMFVNQEPAELIAQAAPLISHAHVSEPSLRPVGGAPAEHQRFAAALKVSGYNGWRSVEMSETLEWREAMRIAAALMQQVYA